MSTRAGQIWRDHSRTIVSLAAGTTISIAATLIWPGGGNGFDLTSTIGGVLLGLGIEGAINMRFREVCKPEDDPDDP